MGSRNIILSGDGEAGVERRLTALGLGYNAFRFVTTNPYPQKGGPEMLGYSVECMGNSDPLLQFPCSVWLYLVVKVEHQNVVKSIKCILCHSFSIAFLAPPTPPHKYEAIIWKISSLVKQLSSISTSNIDPRQKILR